MRNLRIHPENSPLLKLPLTHPAHHVLIVQAESRDICVGRETRWPDSPDEPIDQEWFSTLDQRTWTFSGFAYAFISFDLVLDGWINGQNHLQPFERDFLQELPRLRKLLDECEFSAECDSNGRVMTLIHKAREFFDAFEESIIARVGRIDIELIQERGESLWSTGRTE